MLLRLLLMSFVCVLAACGGSEDSPEKQAASGALQPAPALPDSSSDSEQPAEAPAAGKVLELPPVVVELYNENAYQNEQGVWMLDVIAGQLAFIDVSLRDQEGIPVSSQSLEIRSSMNSAFIGAERPTDDAGVMQFAVRPVQQGEDRISVAWKGVRQEILLNVIADEALQWQGMDAAEGVVTWETLLGSRVTYLDDAVRIDFTKEVQALDGQEVSVIGFILPLESMDKQQHFLLVSTPPSCFFHLPGGPVGAIEVFAEKGLEFDWSPVRLKGRFKLHAPDEYDAVYRLHDAKQEALGS